MSENNEKENIHLDDILEKFGAFSRHQVKTLFLIGFAFMVNSIYSVNYIFSAEDIPYRCEIEECESDGGFSFHASWYNFTAPTDEYKKCNRYERFQTNLSSCKPEYYNNSIIVPCDNWVYYDNTSFVSEFKLACQDFKRTMVGTVHSFGLMIGLIIQGQLSDRIGRKAAICFAGVSGGVFGLAKSYTSTFWMFILFEGLEATFGDVCSPSFILSMESVHSKNRLLYQAIFSSIYGLGGIIMAFIAWWLVYWRYYIRAIYAPSLLFVLYVFYLDESVRWLLSKGKKKEAKILLMKAAKINGVAIDEKTISNLECGSATHETGSPLLETFRSNIVVERFLICVVWWTSCSFIYFGLMINSVALQGNKYINFSLLSIPDIPAGFVVAYILKHFKRKRPLCTSFILAGVLCVAQSFVPTVCVWLSTTLYFIGKVVATFAFATVYIFTSELFPTYTRNSIHALCSSVGRIGAILVTMTPLLTQYWESLPTILFGVCAFVAGALTLRVPDTADASLPDNVLQAEIIGKNNETKTDLTKDDSFPY